MSIRNRLLQDWTHSAWAKAAKDVNLLRLIIAAHVHKQWGHPVRLSATQLDMSEVCIHPRIFKDPHLVVYMGMCIEINVNIM